MEKFLENTPIPWVKVTDPSSGKIYYSTATHEYPQRKEPDPTPIENIIVGDSNPLIDTGSFLITASFRSPDITFIKGDRSTFNLNLQSLFVDSASYAATASYVQNAQTASYVLNAVSASRAITASYVLNAVSSSFASTASFVNPLTQSVAITGSLTVRGNNTTTGTTTLGDGTFTKSGFATGDVLLDNNSTDTPGVLFYYGNNSNYGIDSWNGSFDVLSGQLVRITNKLNETGGAVKMAVDTSGNAVFTGFVKANAWRTGQVINDVILSNTEVTISTTTIATSTSDTDFLTYSYTPLSSTSYLIIHYHLASYDFTGGTGNDSYFSRIKVDGTEITYSSQSTVNGFRTGVLFPLTGRYSNSSTAAKSIVVAARRNSADDSITIVNTATSMWLRITEIAR